MYNFYNKNCVTFIYSSITIIFLFSVSDMTSSSGKQKSTRSRPLTDEDLQNVFDGALADADIYIYPDSDHDDEDTETSFVNIADNEVRTNKKSSDNNEDETTNDDEIIRTVDHNNPIRCTELPNLEETLNEDNYDRLPLQRKQTFLWKAKDKRKQKDYKLDTV